MEDERLQWALYQAMAFSASSFAASQPKAPPVQAQFVQARTDDVAWGFQPPVPPPPPLPAPQEQPGHEMPGGCAQQGGFAHPGDQSGYAPPSGYAQQGGHGYAEAADQSGYAQTSGYAEQAGYANQGGHAEPAGFAEQTEAPPVVEQASGSRPDVDVKEEDLPTGWTDNNGVFWERDSHNPLVWWNLDPDHGWSRWKQPVAGQQDFESMQPVQANLLSST